MAVNRLSAIRRIRVYKKDNKRVVSFRRSNSDKKFVPVKVFCQIIGAFIFSFAFHMPFFLEFPYGTKVGLCNYYGGATDGKYRKELKHLFISSLYIKIPDSNFLPRIHNTLNIIDFSQESSTRKFT